MIWWHVNICAMQVMERYKFWIKLFEYLHMSHQGDRLRSISQNNVALGDIKDLKYNG